ncbi:MAG: hypothetical protein IJ067_08355 [Prevotella sp.]|nr:hypothetical protein [Prevotella sp.]
MALTARLQFGDNDAKVYPEQYLVEDCHCHFTRQYNHFHPETDPRCERVELTVVAPGRENLSLYEWYISGEPRTGRVVFDLTAVADGNFVSEKELFFEEAYCYSIGEVYDIYGTRRRYVRLALTAETITVNGQAFNNLLGNR